MINSRPVSFLDAHLFQDGPVTAPKYSYHFAEFLKFCSLNALVCSTSLPVSVYDTVIKIILFLLESQMFITLALIFAKISKFFPPNSIRDSTFVPFNRGVLNPSPSDIAFAFSLGTALRDAINFYVENLRLSATLINQCFSLLMSAFSI